MEKKEKNAEREDRMRRIVSEIEALPEAFQDDTFDEMEDIVRATDFVARKFAKKLEAIGA